jgi:hypothetical protein
LSWAALRVDDIEPVAFIVSLYWCEFPVWVLSSNGEGWEVMGSTRNGKPGVVIGAQNIDLDLTVDFVSDCFRVLFDLFHALFSMALTVDFGAKLEGAYGSSMLSF